MLSTTEAAKLLRVSERTLHNWEKGRVRIPYAAFKLMRILRGFELPGHHWKGYRLIGDTLWSPEGLAFKAADHYWWSLTVRMAHEFRSIMAQRRQPPAEPAAIGDLLRSEPRPVAASASGFISSKTSFSANLKSDPRHGQSSTCNDLAPPDRPGPPPLHRQDPSKTSFRQGATA